MKQSADDVDDKRPVTTETRCVIATQHKQAQAQLIKLFGLLKRIEFLDKDPHTVSCREA